MPRFCLLSSRITFPKNLCRQIRDRPVRLSDTAIIKSCTCAHAHIRSLLPGGDESFSLSSSWEVPFSILFRDAPVYVNKHKHLNTRVNHPSGNRLLGLVTRPYQLKWMNDFITHYQIMASFVLICLPALIPFRHSFRHHASIASMSSW